MPGFPCGVLFALWRVMIGQISVSTGTIMGFFLVVL